MSAFDENLIAARENEAKIEALLDIANRDASAGKYGAVQEAERLQRLLDATHDPVAEERLREALIAEGVIDEDGELVPDPADVEPVPEGTIDEVLAWVHGGEPGDEPTDGWEDRARRALEAEEAGTERVGITVPLSRALAEHAESSGDAPGDD